VTGGSGYLGQFVVKRLAEAGVEVRYTFSSASGEAVGGEERAALGGAEGFKVDFSAPASEAAAQVDSVLAGGGSPGCRMWW